MEAINQTPFKHGDVVEIDGPGVRHHFQSFGTLRGFYENWARTYADTDVEAEVAEAIAKGHKQHWLNALPNVIAADGLSMRERERPIAHLHVGDVVQVEGVRLRLVKPSFHTGDSVGLERVE